ncbi:hypothetical protein D3C72_1684120 [compost metagenome]
MSPAQLTAIGSEYRKAVETFIKSDTHRILFSRSVDHEKLKIRISQYAGSKDNIITRRMKEWSPRHRFQMRDRFLISAIHIHGVDLGRRAIGCKSTPSDFLSVSAKERSAIISFGICQTFYTRAIGLHDVNIHHIGLILIKKFLVFAL